MSTQLFDLVVVSAHNTTANYQLTIPTDRTDELRKRLARMGRRAVKLGLAEPVCTEAKTVLVPVRDKHGLPLRDVLGRVVFDEYTEWHIDTPRVHLPGWTFLGTVEHTDAGNILRTVPGADDLGLDLTAHRDTAATCDHCRTKRHRKDTYLVLEDGGEVRRVGRNCVADYLGRDTLRSMVWADDMAGLLDPGADCWGSSAAPMWNLATVLTLTAQAIRCYGWTSKGRAAEFGGRSTADVVMSRLSPGRTADALARTKRQIPLMFDEPTYNDTENAAGALEFARAIRTDTDNDYMHNLRIVCAVDQVTGRNFGLACSAVAAHLREQGRIAQRRAEAAAEAQSVHIGRPGDKLGRKLSTKDRAAGAAALPAQVGQVVAVRSWEGDYGITTLIKIVTDEGNALVWFASGHHDYRAGQRVECAATIKQHSSHGGTAQTVITRAKITVL